MHRRDLLKAALALPLLPWALSPTVAVASRALGAVGSWHSRVRPGQPGWPTQAQWDELGRAVGGRLQRLRSPFEHCDSNDAACQEALEQVRNPYYLGDTPALTQSSGWADAWMSRPSVSTVQVATPGLVRRHRF